MKAIYYKLLLSSIYVAKQNGFMSDIWRFMSNFSFSFVTSGNIFLLFLLVNKYGFHGSLDFFMVTIAGVGKYDFFISICLWLLFPIMIINYFLIYYKDRFKFIMNRYPGANKKSLFAIYFLCSLGSIFLYLFSNVEIRI